ncbi:hypothetical protein [Gordonia westfalica]|uniref:Scaffolding protein n=1 Tax=Gordonia westfalica TaxID=158898 RepID=A0A1H2DTK8_9ACTN|nr:hypothetical protein [Gordonia westfalica]SDT86121.1 hypothetical protein SAMN04488548_1226 [Gordonia westfalica]
MEDLIAERDKWKSLSRENEKGRKANADKARKYDELLAQKERDEQTWQERAEKAEAALAANTKQRERDNLAKKIVEGTDVPADLLVGDTEEEMRAHLDRLQSFRGPKQTVPPAAPASVVANADAAPANKVQQLTQADLKNMSPAQIRDADAKGQLDELKGIRK